MDRGILSLFNKIWDRNAITLLDPKTQNVFYSVAINRFVG